MRFIIPTTTFLALMLVSCGDAEEAKTEQQTMPDARAVAQQWNDAHNTKDVVEFGKVFGPTVNFYETQLAENVVIEKKLSFFKKHPDFRQVIDGDIALDTLNNGRVKCSFNKRVTMDGKTTDYPSYLIMTLDDTIWQIDTESDLVTDENLSAPKRMKSDNYPSNAIRGDYDGDGTYEYMWVEPPELGENHGDCIGECEVTIMFNDQGIASIKSMGIGGYVVNHGDLDNNGTDDIGYVRSWWQSVWHPYPVFGMKGSRWQTLVEIDLNQNFLEDPDYEPIRKHPAKKGYAYIYPIEWDDEMTDIIVTKKLVNLN